jgi:hypothetical protein
MTTSRRPPAALWILAPLVLALLYAVAHPLFARTPDPSNVVPEEAVLAHRFRDLATVDRAFGWYGRPDPARWSGRIADRIGALRNVPGLVGVDRSAPFHWVLLPREGRPDPTMAIFTLADEDAFRAAFEDPRTLELGHVRQAQHMEVRGRYAAVAWDGEAARRIGTGGLSIEDRGEDHALVADVPATLRHALHAPAEDPWRAMLAALGYAADGPRVVTAGDAPIGLGVSAGRVPRVMNAWSTLRAWFFDREGRVTVEVRPADAGIREALEAVPAAAGWQPPGVPPRAKAWLWIPSIASRTAVARVLHGAGVDLPEALRAPAPGAAEPSGLFLWAEIAVEAVHAWTIGVAGPRGSVPDLSPWIAGWPGGEEGIDLPPGAAPLVVYDAASKRPVPAAHAVLRRVDSLDLAAVGPEATTLLPTFSAGTALAVPAPPAAGWRLVAAFHLDEPRAQKVLRQELDPHGLLAALGGGAIDGAAWTDGTTLRVDLRRVGP